ncbi:MAG: hypothetical protein ACK44M_08495, partial [Chloroflexus sp.]
KLLLQRGPEQGKHDINDVAGIIRRCQLDVTYLAARLKTMGALDIVRPRLSEFGVVLPSS